MGLVEKMSGCCAVSSLSAGGRQPADGVKGWSARSVARTNDLGARQGLTQDAEQRNGGGSRDLLRRGSGGQGAAPSPATAGQGSPRARVPVIPSPRQGGMELCGRSRRAQSNGRPRRQAGVMTHTSTRRAAPEPFTLPLPTPRPGSALAVAQAVVDQGQQPAGGSDAADAGAAPVGDAVEVGGLLAGPGQPLGGLTAAQRTSRGPCLVMGPRRTVVSDSR